jgi:hypothetical protein
VGCPRRRRIQEWSKNTTKTGKQELGEEHEKAGEKYKKDKGVEYEKHSNVKKEEE